MDIDDADHRVQYTNLDMDWECKQEQHDIGMGTTVHVAHIDKASLSLEFNGTGVDVIGFVNNTNSQELLTCTIEDGQRVGPQVTANDGAQPVTFCSITSLRNGQHTLRVNIGSNGVDNISIDKFHISTDSPPPATTSASAPQTSTSIAPPAASLSAPAVPTQTDRGPEARPPSQTSSGSVSITSSRPTAITGSGSSGSESVTVTSPSPSTSSSLNNIPSQTPSTFNPAFSSGQSQSSVSSAKSESFTSSSMSLETPLASATTSGKFTHTDRRTNTGAIVGGLLGGIITLIIALAALACFRRRLRVMNRQKQESGPRVWQPSPDSARDEMSTIDDPGEPPLKTWTPEAFYTPSSYPDTAPAPVTLDEAFTRPFSLSSSSYTVLPDGLPASHHSSTRLLMSSTSFLSETSRSSVAYDTDDVQSRASSVEDLSGKRSPIPVLQSWYAV